MAKEIEGGNAAGKVAVDLGEHGTIHVPEGHTEHVRYETPDGTKHEWQNPDAVEPDVVQDPEPGADVIYDASVGGYVPRVPKSTSEAGTSGDTQTTD